MNSTEKKRGHYLGTEINEKWWRRYTKDGLLARGIGDYWFDNSALHFHRHLLKSPIIIPFHDVVDIKMGKWHSGKWAGGKPVVKMVWKKGDLLLSSGFVFSSDARETELLIQKIQPLHAHQTAHE